MTNPTHTRPVASTDPFSDTTNPLDEPSKTERVRDEIGRRVDGVHQATQAAGQHVADATHSAGEQSTRFIRENPALALAGAFGVGLLAGMALQNRY